MTASTATIHPHHAEDLYHGEDGETAGPWARVGTQHIRTSRWMEHHWLVVSDEDGATWGIQFAVGLTEEQEADLPWEGSAPLDLPLVRLYPHEVTSVEYREQP